MRTVEITKQPLQDWFMENRPEDKYLWKNAAEDQIMFMRDKFPSRLYATYEAWKNCCTVSSFHWSKSINLPVYEYHTDLGYTILARGNFYDYKVSIESETPVPWNFDCLFKKDEEVSTSCCEGFPEDRIHGSYNQNPSRFTLEVSDQHSMMILAFLLRQGWEALGNKFPPRS